MSKPQFPQLERKLPGRVGMTIAVVFIYLFVVPLDWLRSLLGKDPLLCSILKRQLGKEGPGRAFRDYTPTKQDVIVSTFAKSGTNWMLQMAHQIIFHGEGDFAHIHDVVSWPDMDPKMGMPSIALDDQRVQQLSPEHQRVIKTHLSGRYVPYNDQARYIVVIRDPKEVFVSSYHFVKSGFGPMMTTPEKWYELFLSPRFPLNFGSSWAEHVASYWALRDKPNVLILSYTHMKQDLSGTVAKVANFLGVTLSPEAKAKVQEKSSFAYMKTIDDKFTPTPKGSTPWGDMQMIREGKSGNTQELITNAQQQQIDSYYQEELARLGTDFPYAEFAKSANTPAPAAQAGLM